MLTVIKYQNRKYYVDAANGLGGYVKSDYLQDLFQSGADVRVLDHKTKNDITARVKLTVNYLAELGKI